MNLTDYRNTQQELERESSILSLLPDIGGTALDLGARDGYFSRRMATKYGKVWAVDLNKPDIPLANVECLAADACELPFPDQSFDVVLCAEVLEHIPEPALQSACNELQRVCRGSLVVGVPYKQDLRIGRSTCQQCRKLTPAWGHVNSFDEGRIKSLFPALALSGVEYVGVSIERTNLISTYFLDLAGNPFGVRDQDEGCIHCGAKLGEPPRRNFFQKIFTRFAVRLNSMQSALSPSRPNWIHVRLDRRP